MPLKPIPVNPTPNEAELAPFLSRVLREHSGPSKIIRDLAEFLWRINARRTNPDLFVVTDVPDGYAEYKQSDEWAAIKNRVLVAAAFKCVGCDERATQVHHRDYRPRIMSGEDIELLVALCATCHTKVHAADYKRKKEWHPASHERVLADLVRQKESQG